MQNIILLTDSYKVTHYNQYPPGTEKVYSYFESRGGKFPEICFFGLQYFIKKYLVGKVVNQDMIDEASEIYSKHFGNDQLFYKEGWEYILNEHNGHLPIRIKSIPEGTILPYKNVLFTMENTDPKCFWLTNFLETLLVQVWYPMTVATNSREQKKIIMKYLKETGSPNLIDFKLHDFGFRGVSSVETAGLGAAAHLTQFLGTDTVAGLTVARNYYGTDCAGFSIPASEHSTITSWGKENELQAFENMLDKYPTGLVACVSDSFDIYKACSELWGEKLKEKILNREGTLVIRPDSGEPKDVDLKILEILGEKFGYNINTKGFKVLNDHVRIIQGDGICYETIIDILEHLKLNGWSADNIAFGSGGGLLQKLNRDTQKCAFKCSMIIVNGKEVPVYKDPITDSGKKSKKGWLSLHNIDDKWLTKSDGEHDFETDLLQKIFEDGNLLVDQKWEEIRERSIIL
ncbi:Nicotinate phosphoribosyltransferase (NAPRTase) family [seawater metagenome]|uniref:Nicotinamide phosphoribosyltransferase n=1 Tax=seawater metagenome TaxID=1561972 RepID=A0A5E8CGS9_9ZZZZ